MPERHLKLVPDDPAPRPLIGKVQWYDPVKGFGFVVEDGNGEYHLLHRSVVDTSGFGHVQEGTWYEFLSERRPKGLWVARLLRLVE